ncbi:MAG TPA: hypothetical protein VJU80_06605 [Solirubrobacteraceae bacterium]|nr:hypothetical protein [Solirubrobacteraceae bacterium]
MGRFSWGIVALVAALGLAAAPSVARGQTATAGLGLSDGAAGIPCTLYSLPGCPAVSLSHALFDRYQALASDQTQGANAFRYVRAGIPWDSVSTGGRAIGSPCVSERQPPTYYGAVWLTLAEQFVLAARRAGLDPLISITTNSAARYPGNGNPHDPANPSANQYYCGFKGIVSKLDSFAAQQGIAPPTEYETYDEPDGARVSNACNPTPRGELPAHRADQCAAWYYYEADAANRTSFGNALTLVALSADGDSANDPHLVAVRAYARYLTKTIGLYPAVWSFHPYEDLSATAYLDNGQLAHGDTSLLSAYIASLYPPGRRQASIWLTEAAAQITDPVPTYLGMPEGCDDRVVLDPLPYGLGSCLDGNPRAQAYAASDFLDLARSGSAFPGQITRVYWHQFDSLAGHPTTWDSGLVSPGDAYVRASYCVLSGESVARAVADPACNRVAGAEAAEAVTRRYQAPADGSSPVEVKASARAAPSPATAACPQPWCSFSLIRLRLTMLGAGYGTSESQPSR